MEIDTQILCTCMSVRTNSMLCVIIYNVGNKDTLNSRVNFVL